MLLLLYLFYFAIVNAQANPSNPFIWQILVKYDTALSNSSRVYLKDSSLKTYSQEFQTIFQNKDRFGYNERLVIDMGDACANTSIDDIELWNNYLAMSPAMMSQPSIALVKRGGRCRQWSEKITTVQRLSDTYRLKITAAMIYDDIAYNDTTLIQERTDNTSYPQWMSDHLPSNRNISLMKPENTIDPGTTFIAVYFVPYAYMDFLNRTYLQKNFQRNGTMQTYTQLTFFLYEDHFNTPNAPADSFVSDQSDDFHDDDIDGKPTYFVYFVAGAAVVVLVLVIFHWCRAARRTIARDSNPGHNLLLNDQQTTQHLMPFMDLHTLCPITTYGQTSMTNTACAICLDDFKDDFFVRVLPCRHGYCTACIDVWLTKKSSLCPICKYDCRSALSAKEEHQDIV